MNPSFKTAAILDFETTHLDPQAGKIIEGAVELVDLRPDGNFGDTFETYSSFNDPESPIPAEITKLTGISDEMVRGHRLDWNRFNAILSKAGILIAHNAAFDRSWLEAHAGYHSPAWACSLRMIDWSAAHSMPCRTLKHLAWEHGHFPNAHRAIDDVNTLTFLLRTPGKADPGRTYGQELLANALIKRHLVMANFAPFETKDLLKNQSFRWSPEKKVWWKLIPETELEPMRLFMEQQIYKGLPKHTISEPIDTLDPAFKSRYGLS